MRVLSWLRQPPVIDASRVSDAPLSQKRAWLVESAESVNVATLAGDPALTVTSDSDKNS